MKRTTILLRNKTTNDNGLTEYQLQIYMVDDKTSYDCWGNGNATHLFISMFHMRDTDFKSSLKDLQRLLTQTEGCCVFDDNNLLAA